MELTAKKVHQMKDEELESIISRANFKKKKVGYIKKAAEKAVNGKMAETLKEVIKIAGVGFKVGHMYMKTAFNKVDGITVDTHCLR